MAFPRGSSRPVTRITGLSNRRFCRTCPRRMDVAAETETDPGRRRHWLQCRSWDRRSVTARAENRNSARFDLVSYQLRVGRVRHRPFKSLETGLRSRSRATDLQYGATEDDLEQSERAIFFHPKSSTTQSEGRCIPRGSSTIRRRRQNVAALDI